MQTPQNVKKIMDYILNILFPEFCFGCHAKDTVLCNDCLLKIKINDKTTEENIVAIFDYRDALIKNIIWQLKYHNQKGLGKKMGQILFEYSKDKLSEIVFLSSGKPLIIIPVPSSQERLRNRGYNHAEILARWFCNENPENLELNNNIVFKKSETIHQAKISNKKERLKNIKNSFDIRNNSNVRGRSIVLIDDVTTTGGTFFEIMKILKKAGAKKVFAIALAH